jgi:hypothetical protein
MRAIGGVSNQNMRELIILRKIGFRRFLIL